MRDFTGGEGFEYTEADALAESFLQHRVTPEELPAFMCEFAKNAGIVTILDEGDPFGDYIEDLINRLQAYLQEYRQS